MRKSFAAICAAFLLILVVVPIAHAATKVSVRIEGKEETLFERTIPVSLQKIEASSDHQERNCDGVDELDPRNVAPGITPTLASVEAMESIGETFDGQWYEGFGDYFITRWGPDAQDTALGAYWGILVDEIYTSVGGCQYQLSGDDEVLWIWDAFEGRPTLALYPEAAGYTEGPRPTRIVAEPGEAVPLEVVSFPDGGEGIPGNVPARTGSSPYEGAEVSPVTVSAEGFQRIDTAGPETVITDSEGKASVSYDTPGVYRIKATVGAPGAETTVVRSNGLEICVPAEPGECVVTDPDEGGTPGGGEVPASGPETPVSEVPVTVTQPTTSGDQGAGSTASTADQAPAETASPTAARIGRPRLDRSELASGRLQLSWPVLTPGAGLRSWQVSALTLGRKGGWVSRARGTTQTEATVRLPRGHRYQLRLSVTDLSGHTTTYGLGKVTVPGAGRS